MTKLFLLLLRLHSKPFKVIFTVLGILFISFPVGAQSFREHPNFAFDENEFTRYKVYYQSMLTGNVTAGEATIKVEPSQRKFFGRDVFHIVGEGRSKGAFNWFFKVRNVYESFVDKQAILPFLFIRKTREGNFKLDDEVYFYHDRNIAISRKAQKAIPKNVHDFVSALFFMRTLEVKNFDADSNYFVNFFLDDSVYISKVRFKGVENIKTELGVFRCLKFAPMMATGNVFADAYPIHVWISDDKNHLPILVDAKVIVGSIRMELIEHQNLLNPMTGRIQNKK